MDNTRSDSVRAANQKPTPKLFSERKPLTRFSAIAGPNKGLTAAESQKKPQRPSWRGPIGAHHPRPVRDLAKSLAGAVRKALGKTDDAGTADENAPDNDAKTAA